MMDLINVDISDRHNCIFLLDKSKKLILNN